MTNQEKYDCAVRELAMRRRVYPRWVSLGKMTQEKADREIALMQAIADDYKSKLLPSLFDTDTEGPSHE